MSGRAPVGPLRILVHEFLSGGGLAGQPVPVSLAREGAAMRDALVTDLAALGGHRIVTTIDRRFPLRRAPPAVEVVTLAAARPKQLDGLMSSVDAAWLVAPETEGCLERLAARAARRGVALLGPDAAAIRRAADKAGLAVRLRAHRVPHPETRVVVSIAEARLAANELGFPVILKPRWGAGSIGVRLVRQPSELGGQVLNQYIFGGQVVIQRWVPGFAASVSLLSTGRRTRVLAVNGQSLHVHRRGRSSGLFSYSGGVTPLAHPLAARAAAVARRACGALPGLKGFVGVDVVLTDAEAVVIEVNPRLTTSYLGVRATLARNVAGLALAACRGRLDRTDPPPRGRVRFTTAGRVVRT